MLASVGYGDWKHTPRDLARHESSNKHLSYLLTYISRRAKKVSICKDLEEQKKLVQSIGSSFKCDKIPITKRAGDFRESSEVVGSPQNGNFLGILELLAKYVTFLLSIFKRE